MRNQGAQQL